MRFGTATMSGTLFLCKALLRSMQDKTVSCIETCASRLVVPNDDNEDNVDCEDGDNDDDDLDMFKPFSSAAMVSSVWLQNWYLI